DDDEHFNQGEAGAAFHGRTPLEPGRLQVPPAGIEPAGGWTGCLERLRLIREAALALAGRNWLRRESTCRCCRPPARWDGGLKRTSLRRRSVVTSCAPCGSPRMSP